MIWLAMMNDAFLPWEAHIQQSPFFPILEDDPVSRVAMHDPIVDQLMRRPVWPTNEHQVTAVPVENLAKRAAATVPTAPDRSAPALRAQHRTEERR